MPLNVELQGKVYPAATYEVTAEAIRAYARATNADNERYLADSPIAPPAFPIVPATPGLATAMFDPDLSVNLALLVHGEEDHRIHRPIVAGDVLSAESTLSSVDLKDSGETFTVSTKLTDQNGALAAEVDSLLFIRGTGTRTRAPAAPEPERTYLFELEQTVDEDQTYRYAEASGDNNPIHLDADFAKNVAGLPGIIVHGMCTMAIASNAVVSELCGGDPTKLRRIKVRFSKPVFPGSVLRTRAWQESEGVFGFETLDPRGSPAIRNGVAEIA